MRKGIFLVSMSLVIFSALWFLHERGTQVLAARAVSEGLCANIEMVSEEELEEITELLVEYGQFKSPFLIRYRLGAQSLLLTRGSGA